MNTVWNTSTARLRLMVLAFVAALVMVAPIGATEAFAKGEPVSSDPYTDAASVDYDDGEYVVDLVLEGGTGRVTVSSPTKLSVVGGKGAVVLEWSSPNYDYVVVAGKQYLPLNKSGNAVFLVPVVEFDKPFDLVGDTTAMSEPHEVDYKLTVDYDSMRPLDSSASSGAGTASSAGGAQSSSSKASSAAATAKETGGPASGAGASEASSSVAVASSGSEELSSAVAAVPGPDSSSAQENGLTLPWIVFIVCAVLSLLVIGLAIGIVRGNRNR